MKNLEQIRAKNALEFSKTGTVSGDKGGEVIKKIPPLIINHGLLAAAAYSYSEKEGWQKVFDAIAKHLADIEIGIIPENKNSREKMMEYLSAEANSELLKAATIEAMAWLAYARRFVKKN